MAAAGAIIFLLLPIIIGAAVEDLGLDEELAGLLASSYFVGNLTACVAAVFFVRRLSWRLISMAAYGLFILGLLASSLIHSFAVLITAFLTAGAGAGILFGLAVTIIGDLAHKDRHFGLMLVGQQVFAALILFILPDYVVARWGFPGLTGVLAAVLSIALLTISWIPHASGVDNLSIDVKPKAALNGCWLVWWGLLALTIYFAALSGVWAFVERIADARSLSANEIGNGLAISMLGGVLGGLAVAALGDRFGRVAPLFFSSLVFCGIFLSYHSDFGFPVFTLATFLFSMFWNYVLGYQMGIVADLDSQGRFSVLIPASQALGAVLGAASAGMLVVDHGYGAVLAGGSVGIIVALLIFINLMGSWRQPIKSSII